MTIWRSIAAYLVRVGDALSQLINVAVLLGDNPNESVSGRAHRMRRINWQWAAMRWAINLIFIWEHDHCRASYMADVARAARTLRDHG